MYPLELLRGAWLIFRMHLGTVVGSRRTLAALVLAAAPVVITALASNFGPDDISGETFFVNIGLILALGFSVPLLSVSLGVGVVASEAEGRTITYPFTRPIPRASLFLGRWLASLTLLAFLVGGCVLGMAMAANLRSPVPERDVSQFLVACLSGVTVYSLGSAVIGTLFKRGLVIALGYAFAVEVLLSIVPGSGRKLTLQHYLRSIFLEGRDGFFGIDENIATRYLIPADDAMFRLQVTAGVLLVLGAVTVTRKQFVLSS